MGFSLKLKTKSGQQHIVSKLAETTTVGDLKTRIVELTNIPGDALHVVLGFPPFKPLDLSNEANQVLASGISNGDTLIVEEKSLTEEERKQLEATKRLEQDEKLAKELAAQGTESGGILLKCVVPSDNSCLFTSIGKGGRWWMRLVVFARHPAVCFILIVSHSIRQGTLSRERLTRTVLST